MNEKIALETNEILKDILGVLLDIEERILPTSAGLLSLSGDAISKDVAPTVRTYASPSLAEAKDSEGIV